MSDLVRSAALLCTALGVGCAALVLVRTRELGQAVPVLLEFLLAAGLLRLTSDATWRAIATAALVVALRKLVVADGLRPAAAARRRVQPSPP